MRSWFGVVALLAAGCAEKWSASDAVEAEFVGPGVFGVVVTTTPDAWPEELFDGAVRATFEGDGALASLDTDRDLLQGGDRWVNVLDAFDDCDRSATCERTFRFDVACEGECPGTVAVDAFLSQETWRDVDFHEGAITLVLVDEQGDPLGASGG